MLSNLIAWWDRAELWISTLSFPMQVTVLLVVLVPVSYLCARLIIGVSNIVVSPRLIATARWRDDPVEGEIQDNA